MSTPRETGAVRGSKDGARDRNHSIDTPSGNGDMSKATSRNGSGIAQSVRRWLSDCGASEDHRPDEAAVDSLIDLIPQEAWTEPDAGVPMNGFQPVEDPVDVLGGGCFEHYLRCHFPHIDFEPIKAIAATLREENPTWYFRCFDSLLDRLTLILTNGIDPPADRETDLYFALEGAMNLVCLVSGGEEFEILDYSTTAKAGYLGGYHMAMGVVRNHGANGAVLYLDAHEKFEKQTWEESYTNNRDEICFDFGGTWAEQKHLAVVDRLEDYLRKNPRELNPRAPGLSYRQRELIRNFIEKQSSVEESSLQTSVEAPISDAPDEDDEEIRTWDQIGQAIGYDGRSARRFDEEGKLKVTRRNRVAICTRSEVNLFLRTSRR